MVHVVWRVLCGGRSKSWVEEEGEVFRKGTKLLGPEEMEGEYAGEELRIEVCPLPSLLSFISFFHRLTFVPCTF